MPVSTINTNRAVTYAGAVLQVVQGTTSTGASTSSGTFIDTNLTATITPTSASSKILILVSQTDCYRGNSNFAINTAIGLKLVRNGSDVIKFAESAMYMFSTSVSNNINIDFSYLDSPATTSALTYKTQFNQAGNTGSVSVQTNGGTTSTIVLMEIAA